MIFFLCFFITSGFAFYTKNIILSIIAILSLILAHITILLGVNI